MIDTLPTSHAAIFADTARRKLPRSFYLGAGVALLLHAGLAYYLIEQTFSHAEPPPAADGPTILIDNTPPQPPQPPKTQTPQKPVSHVIVHQPLDPLVPAKDTVPLTPSKITDTGVDKGPVVLEPPSPPNTGAGTGTEPGPAYVTPRWKAFPDAATLTDYYPPRALDNEMEGSASVQCTVLDSAGHVHCTVVAESPKGYGFGQQTVKMVEEKGRVDTTAGDIKIGSVLAVTTVKWQLN